MDNKRSACRAKAMGGQLKIADKLCDRKGANTRGDLRMEFFASIIEQLHQLVHVAGCLIHRSLYDSFGVVRKAPSFDGTCNHLVRQLFG